MHASEVNFDGLVGTTHNYAGLSFGNLASSDNAYSLSNPKAAAKQGLNKMHALLKLGLVQGVFTPQLRPEVSVLKPLGFTGNTAQILEKAYKHNPNLLASVYSASSMWAANAATISPSSDSLDGKVHITPANLQTNFHRQLEVKQTQNILKAVFAEQQYFVHHSPLPQHALFGDEGAANHTRLCQQYGMRGVQIFTYGHDQSKKVITNETLYPIRQQLLACQSLARLHQLSDDKVIYVQQNPRVISQGVFHNDVIAVGNQNLLFYHQQAFVNNHAFIDEVSKKFRSEIHFIEVEDKQVTVDEAVATYLFNSQIVSLADGNMAIIVPIQCQQNKKVDAYLKDLIAAENPITKVFYFDLNESMKNGGGPACLRLRVVLNEKELTSVNQHCLLNNVLYNKLDSWIDKHYRDQLSIKDFTDLLLLTECQQALDELTQILQLGAIYSFQQA